MGKKYAAIFLVFIVIIAGFAACKKAENKGIVITGSDGKTRVLATDENGETYTDDAGNLFVLVTDAKGNVVEDKNGANETQRVAPPPYIIFEDKVENALFSVVIPDGWAQSRADDVRLTHSASGGELNLMIKEGQELNDVMLSAEDFIIAAQEKDKTGKIDIAKFKIYGVNATKYYYNSTVYGAEINMYVFEKNGSVFLFQSVIKNEFKDSVDFEKILNTVKFK